MVSQGGQPELGDTGCGLLVVLVNLGDTRTLLLLVLVVRVGGLASLDLGVGRLGFAGDDGFPSLVKRGVSVEELRSARAYVYESPTCLLLEHQDRHLELAFNLGVLNLDTLQAVDSSLDRRRERLDVTGRAADELVELVLREREQGRVLRSDHAP